MTPAEYEAYVEELVRQLDFARHGTIYRNHRFPGVRQPGEYEVDVAVRTRLSGTVDFLLIVECKRWRRPVDRPVVQKLAQTRDAIAAHKAAVASPVGYTQEAVEVAAVHGIALWVISHASWTILMGASGPPMEVYARHAARVAFLNRLGIGREGSSPGEGASLVAFEHAIADTDDSASRVRFWHGCSGGSAVGPGDNLPGIDPRLAVSQLADEMGRLAGIQPPP